MIYSLSIALMVFWAMLVVILLVSLQKENRLAERYRQQQLHAEQSS